MTTPLSLIRRLEEAEQQIRQLTRLIVALDRQPRHRSERGVYLAITKRAEGQSYPTATGANTFGLICVDREFTPTAGAQIVNDRKRAADVQIIGRTLNGQWVMEDELVLAIPTPPVPGLTGKGRWCIVPQKTYYWGKTKATLSRGGSVNVDVYRRGTGGWEDSTFDQPVQDRLLVVGQTVLANTWVRFEWETNAWIVTNAGCAPDE